MEHSFDMEHARRYGVEEAIMIRSFAWWIERNRANRTNYEDGRHWTYNSLSALCAVFPYWSRRQVERITKSLIDQQVLIARQLRLDKGDQRLWYAFVDEAGFLASLGEPSPNGDDRHQTVKVITERGRHHHQTVTDHHQTVTVSINKDSVTNQLGTAVRESARPCPEEQRGKARTVTGHPPRTQAPAPTNASAAKQEHSRGQADCDHADLPAADPAINPLPGEENESWDRAAMAVLKQPGIGNALFKILGASVDANAKTREEWMAAIGDQLRHGRRITLADVERAGVNALADLNAKRADAGQPLKRTAPLAFFLTALKDLLAEADTPAPAAPVKARERDLVAESLERARRDREARERLQAQRAQHAPDPAQLEIMRQRVEAGIDSPLWGSIPRQVRQPIIETFRRMQSAAN